MRTKFLIRDMIPISVLKIIKAFFYSIRGFVYIGKSKKCPCCEKSYRKFLSYANRKNAMCPRCASLERHRLLYLYLRKEAFLLNKNKKVIHFAPEYPLQKKLKKIFGKNYLSTDIDHPEAMLHADITKIPLENNSFNLILCNHVLQEIPNDKKAIKEIFRILTKNGIAIITVPENKRITKTFENQGEKDDKDRAKLYGYYGARRIYGKDFVKRLENAGFKVEVINYIEEFNKKDIEKCGLIPENIYLCKKQLNGKPKYLF